MKKLKKQKPKKRIKVPALGPQSGAGHEAGAGQVPGEKGVDPGKAAAGPGVVIKTKTPFIQEVTPRDLSTASGRNKKKLDDMEDPGKKKEPGVMPSFELPVGLLIREVTIWLAKKNKKWEASKSEISEIEDGFNKWLEHRLPQLEKLEPEMYLLLPIVAYVMRRI